MAILTILIIIVLGLMLILTEVLIIPGTSVVGFIGLALCIVGMVSSIYNLSTGWALGINLGTLGVAVTLIALAFRSKTWKRFEVKSSIESKVPSINPELQPGMKGVTITRCNPVGIAKFGELEEEVHAFSDWVDPETPVEIIFIKDKRIYIAKSQHHE